MKHNSSEDSPACFPVALLLNPLNRPLRGETQSFSAAAAAAAAVTQCSNTTDSPSTPRHTNTHTYTLRSQAFHNFTTSHVLFVVLFEFLLILF